MAMATAELMNEEGNVQGQRSRNLVAVRVAVVIVSWLVLLLPSQEFGLEIYYLLSAILLGYLCMEVRNLPGDPFLPKILNPIVIASIGTFGCSMGGLLNFFVFADDYTRIDFGWVAPLVNREVYYVHLAMTLACTTAVLTWVSYYTNFGFKLFNLYMRLIPSSKFLSGEFDSKRLLAIVIVSMLIRYFLFKVGLHGRIVDSAKFGVKGYAAGTEYRHLGTFCYVALALTFIGHSRRPTHFTSGLRWVMLAYELFFGFLFAARSAIVYPFLIAFVTQSYCEKRISRPYVGLVVFSLIFAMSVGNEFKTYGLDNKYDEEIGVVDLLSDYVKKRGEYAAQQKQTESFSSFVVNFARHKGKVPECAAAIQYASNYSGAQSSWFRQKSIQEFSSAPIHGFVPRYISGVGRPAWGYYFKNKVLKRNRKARYSIGFSPIGFLFLAGGTVAVLIFGFCYGIALRFTLQLVRRGDLGFLLYLALMSKLYDVHTVVPELIINGIRFLVFLPIAFWFLFKK